MKATFRTKLLLIGGSGTLLMLLSLGIGFWVLWGCIQTFGEKAVADHAHEIAILQIQNNFKNQVQEWKDVLLRGHDSAALKKHWSGLKNMERIVQEQSAELMNQTDDPRIRALLQKFVTAHQEMGMQYDKELEAFKDSKFDNKATDMAVKGMDRAPAELLSETAQLMQKNADDAAKEATHKGRRAMIFSIAMTAAALFIALLAFLWMIQRSILNPAQQLMRDLGRLAEVDFSTEALSADSTQMTSTSVQTVANSPQQSPATESAEAVSVENYLCARFC